jgi:hypothetical protein
MSDKIVDKNTVSKIYSIVSTAILSTYDSMSGIVRVVEFVYVNTGVKNPKFIKEVNQYIENYNKARGNPDLKSNLLDELKNYLENHFYQEIFSNLSSTTVISNILNFVQKTLHFDMSPAMKML